MNQAKFALEKVPARPIWSRDTEKNIIRIRPKEYFDFMNNCLIRGIPAHNMNITRAKLSGRSKIDPQSAKCLTEKIATDVMQRPMAVPIFIHVTIRTEESQNNLAISLEMPSSTQDNNNSMNDTYPIIASQ